MKFVHKDDQVQFCGIVQLSLYLNEVNLHDRLKNIYCTKVEKYLCDVCDTYEFRTCLGR